jgi:hypothetical protein
MREIGIVWMVYIMSAATLTFVNAVVSPVSPRVIDQTKKENFKPSKNDLLGRIHKMEDSLMTNLPKNPTERNLASYELIDNYLQFFRNYPEDNYAPECLDRVQMIYTGLNLPQRAVVYADSLLLQYPNYSNRKLVLENQASTYDMFIQPRDTAKVRYFYEKILEEFPNESKEYLNEIKFRLNYLKLTIPELIEFRSKITVK